MGNFDFESGRRFLAEGEIDEAIRCFLASLDVDRSQVETYVELFRAYEAAWHASGDPDVLDQMRKVAIAGLKRDPTPQQRVFLEEGLDRTDSWILRHQGGEGEEGAGAEGRERGKVRRLPVID
jgi:hypothetical protein